MAKGINEERNWLDHRGRQLCFKERGNGAVMTSLAADQALCEGGGHHV